MKERKKSGLTDAEKQADAEIREKIKRYNRKETSDDVRSEIFLALKATYSPLTASLINQYGGSEKSTMLDEWNGNGGDLVKVFLRALEKYNVENEKTFGVYFRTCLRNFFIDRYRRAKAREGADPQKTVEFDETKFAARTNEAKPEVETLKKVQDRAKDVLSDFEYSVFLLMLKGKKPAEIADIKDRDVRSVYNACLRIRRKLRSLKTN